MPSERVNATLQSIASQIPTMRQHIADLQDLIDVKRGVGQPVTQDLKDLADANRQVEMWVSTLRSKGVNVQ